MIGWRKKYWNPGRMASVCTVVTLVCVCGQATVHTFWPWNLIFGLSNPWDMRKKRTFTYVFRNFHFYAFYWHFSIFSIFSLYNTSKFLVCLSERATGHTFWPRNLVFGLSNPWILFFTLFIWIFRFFRSVFHLGMWYLGWEVLIPLEDIDIWLIFKIQFATVKGAVFPCIFMVTCVFL